MKKYLSLLFVALVIAASACKEEKKQEEQSEKGLLSTDLVTNPRSATGLDTGLYNELPIMSFTDTVHNFGDVPQETIVEYNYTFTNTGKKPLIVSSADGSCGCTVADYPKEPVMPGGSGEIKVSFSTANKTAGHIEKSVSVITNSARSVHLLYVKADITEK